MGKKRRYRNRPKKFGAKYGNKYSLRSNVEAPAEMPVVEKPELAAKEPTIPLPKVVADTVPDSSKEKSPKKKTTSDKKPAAKTTRKRATKAKTTT